MSDKMAELPKPYKMIIDYVTGKEVPEVGAEANRQAISRLLVEEKGFAKEDIEIDVDIAFEVAGEPYRSQVDLVVVIGPDRTRYMAVKCVAGSIGSCEREIVAAARLLVSYQIPIAVTTDAESAIVLDTISGKKIGEGLDAIPDKNLALKDLETRTLQPYPGERLERERLIYRTYNSEYVNVARNLP